MTFRLACAIATFGAFAHNGVAQATALVENGGFETGSFSGWTVTGCCQGVTTALGTYGPRSGAYFADLGNPNGVGALSQSVADDPGSRLTVRYWLASRGDVATLVYASWNGITLPGSMVQNPNSDFKYVGYSFAVVGTGSDLLTIHATDVVSDVALDDVSVERSAQLPDPVPLPATAPMLGLALLVVGGLGGAWRRLRLAAG